VAKTIRRSRVRQVPLSEIENDLSRFLREAQGEEIVITRNGKLAGILIGFASQDDWLDYQLENDPRFLHRVEQARRSLRMGRGIRVEDLESIFPHEEFVSRNPEIESRQGQIAQSHALKASLLWAPQEARITRSALDEDPPGAQGSLEREHIDQANVITFPKRAA